MNLQRDVTIQPGCLCLLLVGPENSHRFPHPECPHHTNVDAEGPIEAMEALIIGSDECWAIDPKAIAKSLGIEPWASGGEPEPVEDESFQTSVDSPPEIVWQSAADLGDSGAGRARVVVDGDGEVYFEQALLFDAMGERVWTVIDRARDEHKQDASDALGALLTAFIEVLVGEADLSGDDHDAVPEGE